MSYKYKKSSSSIRSSSKNRYYAFNSKTLSNKKLIEESFHSIKNNGFCVIDNIIPNKEITLIREEIIKAQKKSSENIKAIKTIIDKKNLSEKELLRITKIQLRSTGREGRPLKPPNDIVWMPNYAKKLANLNLVNIASKILDNQIRIAQLHPRIIPITSPKDESNIVIRNDLLGLPRIDKGSSNVRDWHTDWPHDPSAYGGNNPNENVGFVRSPYPDVTMCLVMIWYFNDVNKDSGGTWVVPGSHKDNRNPRGPFDEITLSAPIPGEIQIEAKSGSVFIQDSRLWHSAPMYNHGIDKRVAVVNRWCPWWLSINEYAPKSRFNNVCRPISHSEFLALPNKLKPLMKHLCPKELDTIQKPMLNYSQAAAEKTRWAYQQLKENSNNLKYANDNIKVSDKSLKNKIKKK